MLCKGRSTVFRLDSVKLCGYEGDFPLLFVESLKSNQLGLLQDWPLLLGTLYIENLSSTLRFQQPTWEKQVYERLQRLSVGEEYTGEEQK